MCESAEGEPGDALGTIPGTSKLRSIFLDAGFASLERVQNSTFDNLGFRIMVVKKPA